MGILIDTLASWESLNPTIPSGSYGIESDTAHYKKGDGTTAWNDLSYYALETDFMRAFLEEYKNVAGSGSSNVIASKSADYDMVYTDGTIGVTTGAIDIEITLPRPNSTTYTFNGQTYARSYNVVKLDSGKGRVKLLPFTGATILGEAEQFLTDQYDNFTFYTNGSNLYLER